MCRVRGRYIPLFVLLSYSTYSMSSGALESPGLLLSYSVIILASHNTIILTLTPTSVSVNHTSTNAYRYDRINGKQPSTTGPSSSFGYFSSNLEDDLSTIVSSLGSVDVEIDDAASIASLASAR